MAEAKWFFIREGFKFYVTEKLTEGIMEEICQYGKSQDINPVIITLINDDLSLNNESLKENYESEYKIRIYLKNLDMLDYKSK